jgi:hypothetical protein
MNSNDVKRCERCERCDRRLVDDEELGRLIVRCLDEGVCNRAASPNCLRHAVDWHSKAITATETAKKLRDALKGTRGKIGVPIRNERYLEAYDREINDLLASTAWLTDGGDNG